MIDKAKPKRLADRLVIVYILFAVLPLLAITFIFGRTSTGIISEQATDMIEYHTRQSTQVLNNEMRRMFDFIYNWATDRNLISQCRDFAGRENRMYASSLLTDTFNRYMDLDSDILCQVFISKDNAYTLQQRYKPSYTDLVWEDAAYREHLMNTVLEKDALVLCPSQDIDLSRQRNCVFYIGIPIWDYAAGQSYGALITGISSSFFRSTYNAGLENEAPEVLTDARSLVVDGEDNIIFSDDPAYWGAKLNGFTSAYELNEKEYVLIEGQVQRTDWRLFSYAPRTVVFDSVTLSQRLIMGMAVVLGGLMIALVAVIVRHQNQRIRTIANGIRAFEGGEAEYKIEPSSNEDLNIIVLQFNKMTGRIRLLVENLRQEKLHTEAALNQRRKAELQTLEAQINPHFLYNTLDTINWMAIKNRQYEISKMLGTMADLLRYSITNIDSEVPVRSEVEWLSKYLYLQQIRFHGRFRYAIDSDEKAEKGAIYKMLVQPLIENSILHAFDDTTTNGVIDVRFTAVEGRLLVVVQDNGCGIEPVVLEGILTSRGEQGIGLRNVYDRLKVYYGEAGTMEIESGPEGTRAVLSIPQSTNRAAQKGEAPC